eukprot:g641.t1
MATKTEIAKRSDGDDGDDDDAHAPSSNPVMNKMMASVEAEEIYRMTNTPENKKIRLTIRTDGQNGNDIFAPLSPAKRVDTRDDNGEIDPMNKKNITPGARKAAMKSYARRANSPTGLALPTLTRNVSVAKRMNDDAKSSQSMYIEVQCKDGANRTNGSFISSSSKDACQQIEKARKIRSKWLYRKRIPDWKRRIGQVSETPEKGGPRDYRMTVDGVMRVEGIEPCLSYATFKHDFKELVGIVTRGTVRTFSHRRLALLDNFFQVHREMNGHIEEEYNKHNTIDFYGINKVDTHVHLAAAFSAKALTSFIRTKFLDHGSDVVDRETGETLADMAKKIKFDARTLTVDTIDVQADASIFNRFDHFNAKYNPCGNSALRTLFLKTKNKMDGRYFAELTRQVLQHLEHCRAGNIFAEFRVSVYGSTPNDWAQVAKWTCDNELFSRHNRWVVQVPRIYRVFKKRGMVKNFQEIISNFFEPLFAATSAPEKYPKISKFLSEVSAFDSVDDESIHESQHLEHATPEEFDGEESPSYAYQLYFFHANLVMLNRYRESRGMNTFQLRPHCGESGSVLHLATAYMLADGVAHGINLTHQISLQYLFYLDQIGIHCSPVSNNFLFLRFAESPFHKFFRRGLNISLSTDDPVQFHLSDDPLLEEYAIARQVWNLSVPDMCEIAYNSVRQCGFPDDVKARWIGEAYHLDLGTSAETNLGILEKANDPSKTNVPKIRTDYRCKRLRAEHEMLRRHGGAA